MFQTKTVPSPILMFFCFVYINTKYRLPKSVEADLQAPVFDGKAPEPVEETAEVAAARAEFQKTFEEVESRTKRESDPQIAYGYNGALPFYTSRFDSRL